MERERIKQKNVLPLKMNQAGVMPLAFTSSLMVVFSSLFNFVNTRFNIKFFQLSNLSVVYLLEKILYWLSYGGLIFISTYLYSTVVLDPKDIAKQFQKNVSLIRHIGIEKLTQNNLHIIFKFKYVYALVVDNHYKVKE